MSSDRVIQRDGYKVVIRGQSCSGALKDVQCTRCGGEHAAVVSGVAWERGRLRCDLCGVTCAHVALASGGTSSRYRYMDGFANVTGHCRYHGLMPAQAERMEIGDDGFRHGTGEWIDYEDADAAEKRAAGKYSEERRDERRKQINADKARARGEAPLFFDAGK